MKRVRFIIVFVALVVLGCVAFVLFSDREPSYQGRTLSQIIMDAYDTKEVRLHGVSRPLYLPPDDADWRASSHDLRAIAPSAIPVLLRWVQTDETAPKNRVHEYLRTLVAVITRREPYNRPAMACAGFRLLGSDAKPALPALVQITYDTNWEHRFCAVRCLEILKPERNVFVSVLTRLSHDPNTDLQSYVAILLQQATNN